MYHNTIEWPSLSCVHSTDHVTICKVAEYDLPFKLLLSRSSVHSKNTKNVVCK
jgi:hypothetical protein